MNPIPWEDLPSHAICVAAHVEPLTPAPTHIIRLPFTEKGVA